MFTRLLAEPELLTKAILVTIQDWHPDLAVPVGKLRRGGHIVASYKVQAQKAAQLLAGYPGFPSPRVVKSATYGDGWEVEWGDPMSQDITPGFLYSKSEHVTRGIYYGYSDEAIAGFIVPQRGYTRKRRMVPEDIRSARESDLANHLTLAAAKARWAKKDPT
jgi:hypothetical protein